MHREGPWFTVYTWREGDSWFARIAPEDEQQACSTAPDNLRSTLAGAVAEAFRKWQRLWGGPVCGSVDPPPKRYLAS
jgi:hypothetical protein